MRYKTKRKNTIACSLLSRTKSNLGAYFHIVVLYVECGKKSTCQPPGVRHLQFQKLLYKSEKCTQFHRVGILLLIIYKFSVSDEQIGQFFVVSTRQI